MTIYTLILFRDGVMTDMEHFSERPDPRKPGFFLEPTDWALFQGNVNGGDTILIDETIALATTNDWEL